HDWLFPPQLGRSTSSFAMLATNVTMPCDEKRTLMRRVGPEPLTSTTLPLPYLECLTSVPSVYSPLALADGFGSSLCLSVLTPASIQPWPAALPPPRHAVMAASEPAALADKSSVCTLSPGNSSRNMLGMV